MKELCPAFLIADFEAAARDAEAAVARLRRITSEARPKSSADTQAEGEPIIEWAQRQSEWAEVQRAMVSLFRTRGALDKTGLALPEDAATAGQRAQDDFAALAAALSRGNPMAR